MIRSLQAGFTAIALLAAALTGTQALELQGGGTVKAKPTKAQLGIISPQACPGGWQGKIWVFSNVPGTFNVMLVRKDGQVKGPYAVTTVNGSGGVVLGEHTIKGKVTVPTDTKYRVAVAGSNVGSNWVPLSGC
jgi:hypothetical protein